MILILISEYFYFFLGLGDDDGELDADEDADDDADDDADEFGLTMSWINMGFVFPLKPLMFLSLHIFFNSLTVMFA
jgi:hypothetical protein